MSWSPLSSHPSCLRSPPFPDCLCLCPAPPARPEGERALNILFSRHQPWVIGGDFKALLSSLCTSGKTANKWNWLSFLIDAKRHGVDTFRVVHHDKTSFTRYRNALLHCDTQIDCFVASKSFFRPLTCPLQTQTYCITIHPQTITPSHSPSAPLHAGATSPPPSTLFCRLTSEQEFRFLSGIQRLEDCASWVGFQTSPSPLLVDYVNRVIPQISCLFRTITKPYIQHGETSVEREFKRVLGQLPRKRKAHSPTLRRLQKLSEDSRERQCKREKKKLHYALVKGAKIKSAINKAPNSTQTAPIHILDRSADPPVIETNPSGVGKPFSNCLSHLGGDPHFVVNQQFLNQFIHNLPNCPGGTASAPLDMLALAWLQYITGRSKPRKATGEDEINYYVLSLLPPSLQRFLLSAIHYILLNAPPPLSGPGRGCVFYTKEEDTTDPANYRAICLIQTFVKLAAAWQCEQLTALKQQHRLIHPCQHGGLKNHRCGDHIYNVVSCMLRSKGRLYHLYIGFTKVFKSVPLHALCTTLRGYGPPEALISSIQRPYDNATDQPLIN